MPTIGEYISYLGTINLKDVFTTLAIVFALLTVALIIFSINDIRCLPLLSKEKAEKFEAYLRKEAPEKADDFKAKSPKIEKRLTNRLLSILVLAIAANVSYSPLIGKTADYGMCFLEIFMLWCIFKSCKAEAYAALSSDDIREYSSYLKKMKS